MKAKIKKIITEKGEPWVAEYLGVTRKTLKNYLSGQKPNPLAEYKIKQFFKE